jgi:hypothetical protein
VLILTKCASTDAVKNLLHLQSATDLYLRLGKEYLLAVADEIRRGRCNVQRLTICMQGTIFEVTEAVKAVASAIRLDQNLERLYLRMSFSDEAGVALVEALTVNTTLRKIDLSYCKATLGAQVYVALSAMLRVNTSLVLKLPPFKSADADERLCESWKQMRIEQRLNQVGRWRWRLDSDSSIVFKWVILRVLENVGKWMTKYKSSSLDSINTVDNNSVLAVVL